MQTYLDDNLPISDDINIQISIFEDTVKSIERLANNLDIFRCENV